MTTAGDPIEAPRPVPVPEPAPEPEAVPKPEPEPALVADAPVGTVTDTDDDNDAVDAFAGVDTELASPIRAARSLRAASAASLMP
jgi:hypothetical protein